MLLTVLAGGMESVNAEYPLSKIGTDGKPLDNK
jgi:hypothetical protein